MPLNNWLFWDRIREFTRTSRIYQQERILQDQSSIDRLTVGGEFLDFNNQSAILEQTNLQINRLERYKDYEQMDQTGEVSLALDLYADEASLIDPEKKHALIIRAKNKRLKEELEDFFHGTLLWDRMARPLIRYLSKMGDYAAEVVLDKNRTGVASLRFMNIYNFTRIETRYGDLVGFFYQDEMYTEPMFLHPWACMHMRLTSFENIYHPYGRCCPLVHYIDTPTGHKRLGDLQPGDSVMSWDGEKAVPDKVIAVVSSGIKPTLIFSTKHKELQVTPEHPVLAVVKDNYIQTKYGPKRDISTRRWILAKDLKIGDKLVLPKYSIAEQDVPLVANTDVSDTNHSGHRLSFPLYVTPDFARLMGFLVGDGWVHRDNTVYFAEGEYQEINRKYIEIIQSYGYDREPGHYPGENSQYGSFQFSSVELARTISQMGLIGKAWEKRIPEWVYTAKRDIQLAFVEGLVDSDGSTNIDECGCERFQLESTSENLIRDLKHLLDRMGYKCGKVGNRKHRNKVVIHGKIYDRRKSWIIYWYDSKLPSGDIQHFGHRRTRYCHNSNSYLLETIISIRDGGEVEVGDIQVENHSNFVADGVVVHNSILDGGRKAFKQLRLMEDAALIYRITRAPEKRKYKIPVGLIPPNQVPEYMQTIARIFKRQRFYNPSTGTFDERYSPLVQEDDFFLPQRPDGSGPDIDILPGAENLDQIADIEYFKKKMIAPLKIPFARVGIGEGSGEPNEKSLSQSSSEFAKAVKWIQAEVAYGLTKVAIIHLALRGFSVEDIKGFELSLPSSSAIEDLYRMETWQTRAGVMSDLKELGWFPKKWIVSNFTDMSPDEIQDLDEMTDEETGGGGGGGGLGGGGPDLGDADLEGGDLDLEGGDDLEGGGEEGGAADLGPVGDDEEKVEGFDYAKEKAVILEIAKDDKKHKRNVAFERYISRRPIFNPYNNILTNNELDGLTKSNPPVAAAITESDETQRAMKMPHNPNNDTGLLVEWSVDAVERDSAIRETAIALLAGADYVPTPDADEITENDLPPA